VNIANQVKRAPLPDGLRHLAGQLMDVDSHEMMPAQVWVRECGPIAERLAHDWLNNGTDVSTNINNPNVPGYDRDDAPIDADSIWAQKGSIAPGAVDVSRRDQIMDLMGIKRQLMFPTGVGMYGTMLAGSLEYDYGLSPSITDNRREYGRELINAYNRWGMRIAGISARVRPALPVVADTVAELMQTVRELIDNGIRAIWLPSALPPGGKSPAHDDLEPFWQLMEAKRIAVCLHGNAETVYRSDEWRKARAFEGFRIFEEIRVDPWSIANTHITSQNFLGTMVLGGVFDRHPDLRFGVIELNGAWLGPLCDLLDMWYDTDPLGMKLGTEKSYRLPRRPSDYIKSNVRMSCFDFEPVDKYVTQYGLEDVLCFASDYPHVEGGRNPIGKWYQRLAPLGAHVVEKFFVTNGQWLLPD
jgi:hypothetical protein